MYNFLRLTFRFLPVRRDPIHANRTASPKACSLDGNTGGLHQLRLIDDRLSQHRAGLLGRRACHFHALLRHAATDFRILSATTLACARLVSGSSIARLSDV